MPIVTVQVGATRSPALARDLTDSDLQRLLGPLHEVTYIHVHDVRAAAYGYGGRTQESRYQRPGV